MDILLNILLTLFAVFIGGIITWVVAWLYYQKAGKELKEEAAELRRLNILMLRGMEAAGWIKFSRNASNEISGIAFERTIGATAGHAAFVTAEVIRGSQGVASEKQSTGD